MLALYKVENDKLVAFDKTIKDPVWETVSLKVKKYIPFININMVYYKKILREIVNE